jgi:hypothetical protein
MMGPMSARTMTEYEIAGAARQCSITGRALAPGDAIASALVDDAGRIVRRDYAAEAWHEPPPGTIGWWHGRISKDTKPRKPTYNDDVLLDLFRHLAEATEPDRIAFRYVVALLLMRRKRLKFEDLRKQAGQDLLQLRDAQAGTKYDVIDPRLDEAAILTVQDEVLTALGWS